MIDVEVFFERFNIEENWFEELIERSTKMLWPTIGEEELIRDFNDTSWLLKLNTICI